MLKNKYLLTIFIFLLCFIPNIVFAVSIEMTGTEVGIRKGPGTNYDRYGYTGAIGEKYTLKKILYFKNNYGIIFTMG